MPKTKEAVRATVYLDPDLHRALKLKAIELESSVSELINEALRDSLAEDAEDLEAFEVRESEPSYPFEDFVRELKQRGEL